MAILELIPYCKDYLWGGNRLKTDFHKQFDGEPLAETWELSCHPDGMCSIANGKYAGRTLADYIAAEGRHVLGANCQIFSDFPVLIKLIDAKRDLSIQVHPNNTYALEHEGQYGKTEMWYILDAAEGASLYYGLKKVITREELRKRIEEGTLLEVLNSVPVKKRDVFFIPTGTIHAIGSDILLAEVQQSSNVTYRVYDYNRLGADGKPRPLHIDKAVDVAHTEPPRTGYDFGGHLARCSYFTADAVHAPYTGDCDDESFTHLLILEGEGTIRCGDESLALRKGSSIFLPAESGLFSLEGQMDALMTRVGTI